MSEYNGWTNYATWRVNLEVFDGIDAKDYFGPFASIHELAGRMKEHVEGLIEYQTTENSIARDYALAFLSGVNWDQIARHYEDAS